MAAELAQRPFDLAGGPLLRTTLLRRGPEDNVFLLAMHHIMSDGWSLGVFWRELAALYNAFYVSRPSPLSELPIQYADFAVWQRDRLQGERLAALLSSGASNSTACRRSASDRPTTARRADLSRRLSRDYDTAAAERRLACAGAA